ncbi:MAG TPA: 5'-3' exonuclease H3TH domain-containing protein, partial [Candidatus Polarisedimenticolia bacterium]|nr:5'-3' exonuclease H3TH domain-containing protein [Candidatus Polarisedimenticolia bacterium]
MAPRRKSPASELPNEPSPTVSRVPSQRVESAKPRIFLIDTMSFIFRAYHAMARQRSMSTKAGLPTAAVLVFVNMLRKLRDDFSPAYLAAVFDVAAKTFRDTQAEAITTVRKFDIKTQTFTEIEYKGYKANRAAMPEDLAQQIPYIRRALEAYRIPILELAGFEADDVIGTLARKAADASYCVYVVSSDKDMMQLVNEDVHILNPPKDNLICDAAKVEEILGVPPERVIDIMALRGDSIDNIPGAPGIGDKGSVEIIKRFGTVEQALGRAAEVEKKTYRESLLNNRDIILFSKSMATIDTNVPLEFNVEAMCAGEPDLTLLRQLFTELEFTSLLKELLPEVQIAETHYGEAQTAAEVEAILDSVAEHGSLAIAVELGQTESPPVSGEEIIDEEPQEAMLPLTDAASESPSAAGEAASRRIAISAAGGSAAIVRLDSGDGATKLRSVLTSSTPSKAIHDYKSAIHALDSLGINLQGVLHDSMLYSYLLDPTYSSHRLADVALRRFNLKLSSDLAEFADVTGRLTAVFREEVRQAGLTKLYEEIDLPLVPVLARMEQAGVKIDTNALAQMST